MPPIVDLAARFREPGATHKATMASEARAALGAGIGTVVLPPDTRPVIDSPAVVDRIRRIAAADAGTLRIELLGALTQQLEGTALAEMSALRRAGCVGVSQGCAPLRDPLLARHALEYARGLGLTVHVFAQDPALADGGCAHESALATRLGLPSIPVAAEVAALRLWISLVEDTGGSVHFQRLSSARGVELVRTARQRGLAVTADVAAHQLRLTVDAIDGFDPQAHVIPPLRDEADRLALCEGLVDGTLAAVCSDHQPHEDDAKTNPFPMTEPGISSLETLLPISVQLAIDSGLAPLTMAQRLSTGPLSILGRRGSEFASGQATDALLVDVRTHRTIAAGTLQSAGRNTPFDGVELTGSVRALWLYGSRVA